MKAEGNPSCALMGQTMNLLQEVIFRDAQLMDTNILSTSVIR